MLGEFGGVVDHLIKVSSAKREMEARGVSTLPGLNTLRVAFANPAPLVLSVGNKGICFFKLCFCSLAALLWTACRWRVLMLLIGAELREVVVILGVSLPVEPEVNELTDGTLWGRMVPLDLE